MTDQQFLKEIKNGNTNVLRSVYGTLGKVEKYVVANSGTLAESHDLFQESVLLFYEKIISTDFVLASSLSTYLFGICKMKWYSQMRKIKKTIQVYDKSIDPSNLELTDVDESTSDDIYIRITAVFNEIRPICKKILKMYYYKNMDAKEIKEIMNYSSSHVLRQQKHRCLKKAKISYDAQQQPAAL